MSFPISPVIAQAAAAQPAAGGGLQMIIMMVVLFGLMYFMMIRPQMKRQKEHRALIAALAKGDEVVTNGGIAGRVEEVGETFITVEIAANVKVKVQKGAVQQVLPKGSLKSVCPTASRRRPAVASHAVIPRLLLPPRPVAAALMDSGHE